MILRPSFLSVFTLLFVALTATPPQAATFNYTAEVTSSIGPATTAGDPDLPPLGTAGTVNLFIDDSVPSQSVFVGLNVVEAFEASVNVPGFLSGSMLNNPNPVDFFELTTTFLAFGSYGPTSIVNPGSEVFLPEGRHSFVINFGTALASVPTTIGEVVAALNAPGANGFFSHELEGQAGFIHTRVSFPATTGTIPLPASIWLLMAAFGGLGWMSRRSA